jgi:hypothetical protein
MEKLNADSILETFLSFIGSYFMVYSLGLQLIELYNEEMLIKTTFFFIIALLIFLNYLILKKYGFDDVFRIHKVKNFQEYKINLFTMILAIFIFTPILWYSIDRMDQPIILFILCLSFAFFIFIISSYYINTYFKKKFHFCIVLGPGAIYLFLIINSAILVLKV